MQWQSRSACDCTGVEGILSWCVCDVLVDEGQMWLNAMEGCRTALTELSGSFLVYEGRSNGEVRLCVASVIGP